VVKVMDEGKRLTEGMARKKDDRDASASQ